MREFEHKKNIRRVLYSPAMLIILGIFALFLVRGAWRVYQKDRDSSKEFQAAKERLAKLEERNTQISTAVEALSTESGVEAEIRDKFQVAKEGEREIVIVDNNASAKPAEQASEGLLQKIWNFFTK